MLVGVHLCVGEMCVIVVVAAIAAEAGAAFFSYRMYLSNTGIGLLFYVVVVFLLALWSQASDFLSQDNLVSTR